MSKLFDDEYSNSSRESHINEGMSRLRDRIKNVEVEHIAEAEEKKSAAPRYTKEDIASSAISMYKERINPEGPRPPAPVGDGDEVIQANTHAARANMKAIARAMASMRNGGDDGPHTHRTYNFNGDVGVHTGCNYAALTVAGTEQTLESVEDFAQRMEAKFQELDEKRGLWDNIHAKRKRGEKPAKPGEKGYPPTLNVEEVEEVEEKTCWKGYKRKPGTKKFADGSCIKEESDVVQELKDRLIELDETSWQAIDGVMRKLAKEHSITPKELHKQFKAENDGKIPDDWLKENRTVTECGYMPLDEATVLHSHGNVYEVSCMWHSHTRRLKFFWPTVTPPTRDDMQKAVEMFYPGGNLITFYPSMESGDNQYNYIVMVPAVQKEEFVWLPEDAWEEMTEQEAAVYELICNDEGEPVSPPMITEEGIEVIIADHDTGEERTVVFEGKDIGEPHGTHYKVHPSHYLIEDDMKGMSVKSGHKRSTESGAGLTEKGVAAYRRKNPGSKLKTAVTTPPSKLKPGSKAAGRRKSFCARSRGWTGERGKAARRRWNC